MAADATKETEFEIGHVLFIDIVGYSKLLIEEQKERLADLTKIVLGTAQVRDSTDEQLVRLPTGDGMALVFHHSAEEPARCALEIAQALKAHPEIRVRMGMHSGPVSEVTDVSGRSNVAGAGINLAQRVMDCGDAGHILLSQRVADDLAQYRQWSPRLHDLGECEVKHGVRLHVVNLYTEELGNPTVPEKLKKRRKSKPRPAVSSRRIPPPKSRWPLTLAAVVLVAVLITALLLYWRRPLATSAAVSTQTASPSPTPAAAPETRSVPEKSIAVLPFENRSEDKANAYFADGIQDEILTDLAEVADLKVISRTSVINYRQTTGRNLGQIGQELGVAHVLEGSVQRAGNRVRVNAQLVDTRTDAHLWAQTYDRDLADVFAIQSEIAKAIADQLQAKLSPREKAAIEQAPTTDVTAFDLYSRAKTLNFSTSFNAANEPSLLHAAELLNQAVTRDPSFFQAYCQLAYSHDSLYFLGYDHTAERLALAETALRAAFRLQPDSGEAHLARAQHLYRGYLDYESALAELEIARRTLPNDPRIFELTGYIQRRQGHLEEGLQNLQRALELDPRNLATLQQTALTYNRMRRYSDMAATLDRALAIIPNDVQTQVARAMVDLEWKADTRSLHEAIESVRTRNPAALQSVADNWVLCALAERDPAASKAALAALDGGVFGNDAQQFSNSFGTGLVARMMNDKDKARAAFTVARAAQEKIVQAQPGYGPALCVLGVIDAGLDRKEEALREGRRALELLPVEKDSINGAQVIGCFAIIAAWVGEKDLACEQLETNIRLHNYGLTSYGQLKLSPFWDPLRGDPRFEKIVADLAPKDVEP